MTYSYVNMSVLPANMAYIKTLNDIIEFGTKDVSNRNEDELGNTTVLKCHNILYDANDPVVTIKERKLNYHFMVREAVHIMAGRNDVEYLAEILPAIRNYSDDGKTFSGAYGPYWYNQHYAVAEILKEDIYSRRARIIIGDPYQHQEFANHVPVSKDVPCTMDLVFHYDGKTEQLNLHVCMRSSDAYTGLPYDMFVFAMMLQQMCYMTHQHVGTVCITATDRHIYNRDNDKSYMLAREHYKSGGLAEDMYWRYNTKLNRTYGEELSPLSRLMSIDEEWQEKKGLFA